ncbi:hypothetical protein B7486_11355 [cyanobacterium TDX16]|nr:hypothetical protein B7486_11355 [cyanobacterium TDX16]
MSGESRESRASGITYIVLTLVGWSSVLLFLKHLTPYIDAWTANGWRYGMSALLWLPVLLVGARGGTLPEGIWRRALVPALFNCMAQVCFAQAPYYIGPGLAGFLLRINIVFSTAGALILFADERPLARSPMFWGGLVLVVAGSIGTVLMGSTPLVGGTATGVILGLGAGAFYGLYGVSVRYWMHGIRPMVSFGAISLYTAAVMVSLMIVISPGRGAGVFGLSGFNWMILVMSALIGIALGHVFYYSAIARLGVAISAAVVQLAPFITGVASVLIFGEVLTSWQWMFGAIMLMGAGTLIHSERSRRMATTFEPELSAAREGGNEEANAVCAAPRVP